MTNKLVKALRKCDEAAFPKYFTLIELIFSDLFCCDWNRSVLFSLTSK